jgi:hypothetical protein
VARRHGKDQGDDRDRQDNDDDERRASVARAATPFMRSIAPSLDASITQ